MAAGDYIFSLDADLFHGRSALRPPRRLLAFQSASETFVVDMVYHRRPGPALATRRPSRGLGDRDVVVSAPGDRRPRRVNRTPSPFLLHASPPEDLGGERRSAPRPVQFVPFPPLTACAAPDDLGDFRVINPRAAVARQSCRGRDDLHPISSAAICRRKVLDGGVPPSARECSPEDGSPAGVNVHRCRGVIPFPSFRILTARAVRATCGPTSAWQQFGGVGWVRQEAFQEVIRRPSNVTEGWGRWDQPFSFPPPCTIFKDQGITIVSPGFSM